MLIYEELSNKILKAYFTVKNTLGKGLEEKVYENALCIEFDEMGIPYVRQKRLFIDYKGQIVGDYFADIWVDDKIILELKSVPAITEEHIAQTLNYINLTHSKVGYILNFSQLEGNGFKRILGLAARSSSI
ncbi:MAG: GxxExxY protein [Prevotella sp.]|jgi:GxxExxY protein|nr:GxxExxY protein [Prevotella sp.]